MKDYSNMNGFDLSELLRTQPQFAEHADWSKLDGYDWACLLTDQPQLAKYADWSKLSGYAVMLLIKERPQFANHVDWSKLDGNDWCWLLKDQPQLINTEELQIMAITKSKEVLDLLIDPSDRIKRLHDLTWKI